MCLELVNTSEVNSKSFGLHLFYTSEPSKNIKCHPELVENGLVL